MPQDDLQGYLKSVPTTDSARADAWDAFNGATDQNDFQTKVSRLPIPDDAKADLWDAKYSGKPVSVYKGSQMNAPKPTPQANPSSPQEGIGSRLWKWANTTANIGHLRENAETAVAHSNAPPTLEEANTESPYGYAIKKAVEGFSGNVAKSMVTPLGIGLTALGPVGRIPGAVGTAARLVGLGAGAAFAGQGAKDIAQHTINPDPKAGFWDGVARTSMDLAMITGGAATAGQEIQGIRNASKPGTQPVTAAPPNGAARSGQALGTGPSQAITRTVHVSPDLAAAIDNHNSSNLPGKRFIVKSTKTGKQSLTLANQNPDTGGFDYQNFRGADGKPTLDNSVSTVPGKNTVPVNLSTVSGNRGTAAPGHFLTAEPDRAVSPPPATPIAAPQTAQGAPATSAPVPTQPKVAATPPTPPPANLPENAPTIPVESKGVITPVEPPKMVDKTVVPAQPSRGIQEVKLPTRQAGGVSPGLPAELLKSAPRYGYQNKNFELQFEDPRDLAAYTITQSVKNKAHSQFVDYLQKQYPDASLADLKNKGAAVRNAIREQAKVGDPADGPLVVGKVPDVPTVGMDKVPMLANPEKPVVQPTVQASTDPAALSAHEDAMRPLIGETMRLAQLRRGELASHAIDTAMRETRDPSGSIPDNIQDQVSRMLGEKVGGNLTPAQMTKLEQLRGATVSEEPKITYLKRSEAEDRRSDPLMGDKFEKQLQQSQDDLIADLSDPNISTTRQAKLMEALEPDSKGNMKYFTYDRGLEYPKPVDLPSDHPEFPFAPKALGHEITPITGKNLEAVTGKQPYNLHLGTSSGNRYLDPADLAKLESMKRGEVPGLTPLPEQVSELLGTKESPEAHGMSVSGIDDSVKAGSDVAEFDRQLRQKALDSRQAKTLGVLKGQIGKLAELGGPSETLRSQLDALSPEVKKLLPKELFNEKSLGAEAPTKNEASNNPQSVTATRAGAAATKSPTAGKPTRFEGIKTTGIESQILEKFPERARDIETIQKGVADRFEPKQRQKAYKGAMDVFAKRLVEEDPYALKQGMDTANKKPFTGTTSGIGLGGAQELIPQRIRAYTPGEVQAIAYSASDAMLSRWEDMTNAELAKKKAGLWKDSLVNAIDQARPTDPDPIEYQVQKELHDELVARHNQLKTIAGPPTNLHDSLMEIAKNYAGSGVDSQARQIAGQRLREVGGTMDRNNVVVRHSFDRLDQFMNQLSEPERYRFWDNMTRGGQQIDDPLTSEARANWEAKNGSVLDPNQVASSLRSVMDAARDRVIASSGNLQNFFVDYMPGLWDNQSKGKSFTENWVGNRNFQGDTHFLKQKMYEYYNDALNAGLQPTTTNPVRGAMMITEQLNRYSMAHDFKNRLLTEGLADHYQNDEAPPEGWERLDDRLFNNSNGAYWAPKSVARTFNNFTSAGLKSAWKVPYTNFSMYDALRSTNNMANRFQLGFSLFHGMETMLNSGFTTMALGLKQTVNEGRIMSGLTNLAKGGTFIIPLIEDVWNGQKGLVNFRDPTQALDYAQLGSDLEAARANVADPRFKLEQMDKFRESFKSASDALLPNKTRAAAVAKAGLHLLGSAVETAAWPIMNGLVPRVKIGAFYKMAQQIHSEYDGSPPDVINLELQKAWNSVDNRFGQVSYQNMFMNKTVQGLATLAVRSPGWNIGTVREVGGGVLDLGKSIGDFSQGKQFKISNRTAYTAAMVMGTMMVNSIYQSLHPSAPPVKGIDYFYPQDGTKTAQGEANRVYPKTYVYDFINGYQDPFGTVGHKAAPDISTLYDIIHNSDYYHQEIRDPGDSAVKQAVSTMGYMAHQFVPFSFGNLEEARLRGQKSTVESFSGILPAPKWAGRTPAENLAYKYFAGQESSGGQDPADLERRRSFIELRNRVAQGTLSPDDLQKAIESGKINPEAIKYLYDTLSPGKTQLENWADRIKSPNQLWNVWGAASDEEKKVLLLPIMSRVLKDTTGKEQEDKIEELQKFATKMNQ